MGIEEDDMPDDPIYAQQEKEYLEFLERERQRRGPRPEGLRIDIEYGTEGPAHDPYGVTIIKVVTPSGKRVTFRDGALSDKSMKVDGYEVSVEPDAGAEFLAQVGHTIEDIEAWFHEAEDIREAELNAGWDPNP